MSDLVPSGWSRAQLSDVCYFQEGPGLRRWQYTNEGYPFINIRCIKHGYLDLDKVQYISQEEANEKYQHFFLNEGDYVLSSSGTLGRMAEVKKVDLPIMLNTSVIRFRSTDEDQLCSTYLPHYLQGKEFVDQITEESQGSAQVNFGPTHLKLVVCSLPPLPEQQKIAAILSSVDEVIEKTQAQISKLKDLKTGMMPELLSPREGQAANINNPQGESKNGLHHTEFKDSPLGRIPVGWEVVKFESATVKIQDGTHFSPQSKAGECLYLTSKNIQNGKLDLRKISYISQKEHDGIYKRCNVQFGDVLLTKDGANTGNCAMNTLTQPFSLLSSVAFLRCDTSQCLNEFMYQYILSSKFQRIIQDSMTGNAITRLTLTIIKNMNLTLPPINEQKKIVGALSSVDRYIDEKIKKMEAIKKSKKALMQDLLTGKVRVNVD